ncbi:glycosyltransferase [Fundidesulfovibrio terrae]|uniref:glycosyltransferase family protein n=1 Tax=Fundidesulfovibrio terrae TaxID=2922866 RepID=UPI002435D2E4|nr:glycosyltransferase [Fundidesulfovibrio terrae]
MSGARPLAVYVSPGLAAWLDALPFETLIVTPGPGIFDLAAELETRGVTPDVIIQDEVLAPRTLLKGLEKFRCPKLFWSRDPHLNHYWQAPYAGLFDAVASTQKAQAGPLAQACAGPAAWITWSETPGPWVPHSRRAHGAAFVGRVTQFRPLRRMFTELLLSRHPIRVETDIPHPEVPGVYAQARLAPNESILGETTHRLFAATAQGCLVLEPARDNGLEELFEPGREVVTYEDGLELLEVMAFYSRRDGLAEKMGRAAWERCGHDHRPENRLVSLGELAHRAAPRSPSAREHRRLLALAAAHCLESSLLPGRLEDVLDLLEEFQDDPECVTAALRLLTWAGQPRQALSLAALLASAGFAPGDVSFQVCLCVLFLRQDKFELARAAFGAFAAASGEPAGEAVTPAGLYAVLGDRLARRGRRWRPGFPFDPQRHLPATASECYLLSLTHTPGNLPVLRKAEALLRDLPGSELARMAYLSEMSLRNREDFRLGMSLGLADLRAFRVDAGLDELRLAREQALAKGKAAAFEAALAARDPSGRIRAAL